MNPYDSPIYGPRLAIERARAEAENDRIRSERDVREQTERAKSTAEHAAARADADAADEAQRAADHARDTSAMLARMRAWIR